MARGQHLLAGPVKDQGQHRPFSEGASVHEVLVRARLHERLVEHLRARLSLAVTQTQRGSDEHPLPVCLRQLECGAAVVLRHRRPTDRRVRALRVHRRFDARPHDQRQQQAGECHGDWDDASTERFRFPHDSLLTVRHERLTPAIVPLSRHEICWFAVRSANVQRTVRCSGVGFRVAKT